MKKILVILLMALGFNLSVKAQEKTKTEVKQTTTVGQKVHNTFSKHKRHKGYKVKHKVGDDKNVKKVDNMSGEVKQKTKS